MFLERGVVIMDFLVLSYANQTINVLDILPEQVVFKQRLISLQRAATFPISLSSRDKYAKASRGL